MDDEYGIAKAAPGTNRHSATTDCVTCGGDRFVTVRLRSPETTMWMQEHGLKANPKAFHEEVAPCPDCHPIQVSYWQHNGRRFTSMDAAAAREALRAP